MSETVQLAWIAMFTSWGNAFITRLDVIVGAVGAVGIAWWVRRVEYRAIERAKKTQLQVQALAELARRTRAEAEMMATGAFREGHVAGAKEERRKASGYGDLTHLRDPVDTDAFMAGKG